MTWAHVLSKGGAMSNPFEYEEIMAAAFQFGTTKTVEEVVAEHKRRSDEAEAKAKSARNTSALNRPATNAQNRPAPPPPVSTTKPRQSEMDKVRAMLANAPMRPKPLIDPDAE